MVSPIILAGAVSSAAASINAGVKVSGYVSFWVAAFFFTLLALSSTGALFSLSEDLLADFGGFLIWLVLFLFTGFVWYMTIICLVAAL